MADVTIGIDLGTTNSVVASTDRGGEPRVLPDEHDEKIHPSVVSFHPNGTVIVGAVAKQRRVIDPKNTVFSVKRLIGRPYDSDEVQAALKRMPFRITEGPNEQPIIHSRGGQFAIPEISAIVLDHMRAIARRAQRTETAKAVITVPANFNEGQRSATATAGAIAGLEVVRILNEPTAAAIAYGHRRKLDQLIAVYDFGGGTFDVSLLQVKDQLFEVIATAGNTFLGGDDIDETLVEHMVDIFLRQESVDLTTDDLAMQRLRSVAEQIKIQLSRRSRAIVKIDEIAYGPGGRGLDLNLEITREELVARCAHVVDQTFPVCDDALKLAGIDRNQITNIVLVGGTTKMPYVRQRATQYFGKQPRVDVNPDEAVALGAALQANVIAMEIAGEKSYRRVGTAEINKEVTRVDPNVGDRVASMLRETKERREQDAPRSVIVDEPDTNVEFGDDHTDGSGIFVTVDLDDEEQTLGSQEATLQDQSGGLKGTVKGVVKGATLKGRPRGGPDEATIQDPSGGRSSGRPDVSEEATLQEESLTSKTNKTNKTNKADKADKAGKAGKAGKAAEPNKEAEEPKRSPVSTSEETFTETDRGWDPDNAWSADAAWQTYPPNSAESDTQTKESTVTNAESVHEFVAATKKRQTNRGAALAPPTQATPAPTREHTDTTDEDAETITRLASEPRATEPVTTLPLTPNPALTPTPGITGRTTSQLPPPVPPRPPGPQERAPLIPAAEPLPLELAPEAVQPPAPYAAAPSARTLYDPNGAQAPRSSPPPTVRPPRQLPHSPPSARTLYEPPAAPPAVAPPTVAPPLPPAQPPPRPFTAEPSAPAGGGIGLADTSANTFPMEARPAVSQYGLPELGSQPFQAPEIRDVTSYTLGIGTVSGYCEPLIARNTQIPHQVSKSFSTSKDGQSTVRIKVFQGESRRLDENARLGDVVLQSLPARPRGETTIDVTFKLNASGLLDVHAIDLATGQQQQASLEIRGVQTRDEVAAAQDRMRGMFQ